jgi:hypothetical protein
VLSSASKWRPHVVPAVPAHRSQRSQRSQCEHSPAKDTKRSKLTHRKQSAHPARVVPR